MRRPSFVPVILVLVVVALSLPLTLALTASAFAQEKKELRWGTDPTGGAPYVYKPKGGGNEYIGFEVELAAYLAGKLGRESKMVDGTWIWDVRNLK